MRQQHHRIGTRSFGVCFFRSPLCCCFGVKRSLSADLLLLSLCRSLKWYWSFHSLLNPSYFTTIPMSRSIKSLLSNLKAVAVSCHFSRINETLVDPIQEPGGPPTLCSLEARLHITSFFAVTLRLCRPLIPPLLRLSHLSRLPRAEITMWSPRALYVLI